MHTNNLYCSQYKDVDRSTMGTATTTDENGATVRRSTRERIMWVIAPAPPCVRESIQFFSLTLVLCCLIVNSVQPNYQRMKWGRRMAEAMEMMGKWFVSNFLRIYCLDKLIRVKSTTLTVHHDTLDCSLLQSNKENEPSSLNSTAPPTRRLRDTSKNPYSKDYCKPLQKEQASRSSSTSRPPTAFDKDATKHMVNSSASLATIEEEEETSPIIRRILQQTGCSSRQELLAMRAAQQKNTMANGSKSAATIEAKAPSNVSKSTTKSRNGSKAAPNVAKNVAKSTTNPKKKAKSKYSLDTIHRSTSKWCHSLNSFLQFTASNRSKSTSTNGSKSTNANRSKSTKANTNGTKASNTNGSKSAKNGSKSSHGTLPHCFHWIRMSCLLYTSPSPRD